MPGTWTAVIPTYNEEKNIANMARRLRELYPDINVMFMDDNSTDRSKELIAELNDPKINLITRKPEERGLAASVFQGILECGTDYFMTIDCDFQHPPEALGDMYKKMEEGADLCVGTRVDRFALGFFRWAGSWFFNVFCDVYLLYKGKTPPADIMSGLFAARTDVFVPVIKENFSELEMQGWKVLFDLIKYGPSDIKISTIKYRFSKRAAGESHINKNVVLSTFNQCGRFGKFCANMYKKLKDL
ncbi:MAG: glycosyltransferase [Methanomassiliicoccaceae archaeon]|jgi:dolichol-phosphate mannosyltransferase|nr:glycosyltransferase [Methanomassiliicoccaceae archaeon]